METPKKPIMEKRIYTLDVMKFVASVLIVFHHYQQLSGVRFEGMRFFGEGTYYGCLVELFFMISGYLVASQKIRTQGQPFKNYMLNKCIRIYPMAILATGFYCVLAWVYYACTGTWWDGKMGIWRILTSISLTFCGGVVGNVSYGANNPVWYLCVLLICYVIFYILLKLVKKYDWHVSYLYVFMIGVGLAIKTYGINLPFLNGYTCRGYIAFFIGAILYEGLQSVINKAVLKYVAAVIVFGMFGTWLSGTIGIYDDVPNVLCFIFFPALMILLLEAECLKKIFGSKRWSHLGQVSFEIYLWHCPMFFLMILVATVTGIQIEYTGLSMLGFSVLVIVFAEIVFWCIEKPLGRKLKDLAKRQAT